MFISLVQRSMQKLGINHCDYCRLAMPSSSTIWCEACLSKIKSPPRCQCCGLQTPHPAPHCGVCLTNPPKWDRLYCISDYIDPVREYIHRFKYGKQFWLAQDLSVLLSQRIPKPAPIMLTVPLHWRRYWWRTYNQSTLLGWALEQEFHKKGAVTTCIPSLLTRTKATLPQQGLSRTNRQSNLIGAFKITQPITEKHVAVIDDVVTTGATVNQICIELRKVGVEKIDVYTLCRTEKHHLL